MINEKSGKIPPVSKVSSVLLLYSLEKFSLTALEEGWIPLIS